MFGLNKMYQEREQLYLRCKREQAKAAADRGLAKRQTLETISSTKGLVVSFVLGLTTQCDTAQHTRRTLLKGLQTEVLGVIGQYVAPRVDDNPRAHAVYLLFGLPACVVVHGHRFTPAKINHRPLAISDSVDDSSSTAGLRSVLCIQIRGRNGRSCQRQKRRNQEK